MWSEIGGVRCSFHFDKLRNNMKLFDQGIQSNTENIFNVRVKPFSELRMTMRCHGWRPDRLEQKKGPSQDRKIERRYVRRSGST
ncbi:MAG: hypothetical protein FNP40_04885 [Dehalobacter sp. 4CP]|nr:hypothetical protein [Dehalobacter sp. 4CP]